ncbi:MAG: spermidine synthase [Rhizomicrobium sp.]
MIPWVLLDKVTIQGGDELRLMRRGEEFSILSGSATLMSSRMSGSEKMLADLACARIGGRAKCHVLIGGFGMGFTLRVALAGLGADARVTVAELVPAVVAWARGPMAHLSAGCLDDPRVTIREEDVHNTIAGGRFDAILLDVDNGPDGLTQDANDRLYNPAGLHATRKALRPRGVLAVWSAAPSPKFTRRLLSAGFTVEEIKTRANSNGRGPRHIIWMATAG